MNALSVDGLRVAYAGTEVLRGVSFALAAGETLALVGLSGCGKTTLLRALLGLLPASAQVSGVLREGDRVIDIADRAALRARLGRGVGFVAQNPFDACAPLRPVRKHVEEAWRALRLRPDPARIAALCAELGLAPDMLARFPHEWSGGMLQRANIAAAVALAPPVLLADEPTSALDADTARAAMDCLKDAGRAVLVVSHDLALMDDMADRVLVMDRGRVVEGARGFTISTPASRHCVEPEATKQPRVSRSQIGVASLPLAMTEGAPPTLEARGLVLRRGGRLLFDNLSFTLTPGKILGIAGPSGSGKSSLLAVLSGALVPASGQVLRNGTPRAPRKGEVLPLFQDALSSMNPRWPLARIIAEPLTLHHPRPARPARVQAAAQVMERLGLGRVAPAARPHMLSSGQAQRVAMARALMARPALVLADEPTSALDPRQKALALEGLAQLAEQGAAVVLVSHDRAMLNTFCDDIITLTEQPCASFLSASAPAIPNI